MRPLIRTAVALTFLSATAFTPRMLPASDLSAEKHDEGAHEHSNEKGLGAQEEEENGSVGKDKGILELHRDGGLKLSPEAYKNFEIQTSALRGESKGLFEIPQSALLQSQGGNYVYRYKDGFFKKMSVRLVKRSQTSAVVGCEELKRDDSIVTNGVAFLRAAELDISGGIPHSH